MLIAAAALALAGLAAGSRPARADVDDLLRFLAGAVIIGAIVNAIDDSHTPRYVGRNVLPDSCLETVRVNWRTVQVYNARCLNRGGYYDLPRRCERSFRINGRNRRGYVAECMWEAGYSREGYRNTLPRNPPPRFGHPPFLGDNLPFVPAPPPIHDIEPRLPSSCQMTYRQNNRSVQGYWARCLRNSGFRNLPQSCRLQTRDGDRLFNAQCLYNAGYRH